MFWSDTGVYVEPVRPPDRGPDSRTGVSKMCPVDRGTFVSGTLVPATLVHHAGHLRLHQVTDWHPPTFRSDGVASPLPIDYLRSQVVRLDLSSATAVFF